ncbi:extracellular cell wall glucanase Crf1 [Diaporthe helianthi]|uniref:Extracellular cell wall glucanase Crf1 n=1 Tax=Diaporthe helianthi TaxID=158607 RepID=A0A2P5HQE4_DIAHE|nr:extracellular cell wall glucanase Crf1 [Diaporthe helianthi]
MRILNAITSIGIIGITAVSANCNPLKETCAPIPGITSPIHQDFTKFSSIEDVKNSWTIADYASFRTDSKKGGVFPIEKRTDAPYIWTTGYFLYGHVDVMMQAAPGIAVISSAVLLLDTADEIDWEWSGNNYRQAKPNFEMTAGLHKYSIDWTAERLTWSIDGQLVRTLLRKDCDNADHQYPQTPSRFHLGVWVAGDPDRQAEGVRQWAGGNTDFTRLPYIAYVRSVDIEPSSKCAYYNYTDKSGSSNSVKCLAQLPHSVSSVVSSSALKTLGAAQPAPPTTSQVTSSSRASSSSSSSLTITAGTTLKNTASTRNGGSSSSPESSTGGTTSTNITSSRISQATGSLSSGSVRLSTSTVYKTTVLSTVTSCNTKVTSCPANKPLLSTVLVTDTVVDYTTVCPVTEGKDQSSAPKDLSTSPASKKDSSAITQTAAPSNLVSSSSKTGFTSTAKAASSNTRPPWWYWFVKPGKRPVTGESTASSPVSESTHDVSGEIAGTHSEQDAALSGTSGTSGTSETLAEPTNPPALMTTSVVYNTNVHTVTSCGLEVESCPAKSTVLSTEVVVAYTTVCPVSTESSAPPTGSPEPSPGSSDGPSQIRSVSLSPSSSSKSSEDSSPEQSLQASTSEDDGDDDDNNLVSLSSSTMSSSTDANDMPPPSTALAESQAASTSLMGFGHGGSASLYNTDTEVNASGSSTASAATLLTDKGAPPIAQNHAVPGMESSQAAGEHGSARRPAETGPTEAVHSSQATGLAAPVPASSDDGTLTTRSTITRTKTIRLTTTRPSTSTLFMFHRLVDHHQVVDVALSSAGPQGASGVAGAGTGTGQQPGGAKTTLATIAGAGRALEAVPGLLLLALAMGGGLFL